MNFGYGFYDNTDWDSSTGDEKFSARQKMSNRVQLIANENLKGVVADPLYRPVCPENVAFYELPHIAFSGRIYKKKLPVLAELI